MRAVVVVMFVLLCGCSSLPGVPQSVAPSTPDKTWRPAVEQQQRVLDATRAYFAARDGNRFDEAYAFLSDGQRRLLDADDFRQMASGFNTRAGVASGRVLTRVTWFKDTPEGGPGLFVTIDFDGGFAELPLHCGYVVWKEQADGRFLHVREEAHVINRTLAATLGPEELQRARTRLCGEPVKAQTASVFFNTATGTWATSPSKNTTATTPPRLTQQPSTASPVAGT